MTVLQKGFVSPGCSFLLALKSHMEEVGRLVKLEGR